MNPLKSIFAIALLLCLAASFQAQRRGARRKADTPAPKPSRTPTRTVAPGDPIPLAILNGQTITTSDIHPDVSQELLSLDERIADARRQILDLYINSLLLEVEARKRRVTSEQLYQLEVTNRLADPTAAEIKAFIANNEERLADADPATVRSEVVAYLRNEREGKLSEALVKKLRATNAVVMKANWSANLSAGTIVATVAGQPVFAGVLEERVKPIVYRMRVSAYMLGKEAVDQTIRDLLLLAEANGRGVGPEQIVRAEVTDRIHAPTEAEVAKVYEERKSMFNGDLDSARNQIAGYLQEQQEKKLQNALYDRLRKGADIKYLISEPPVPVLAISTDDDPSRGTPTASVTIVEFTDFQCPACAAMQPVLEDVLKSYGDKVRLVVRDFPLPMHANARKAAEAADAADAQGKFFEYTALLFKRQDALDTPSLKKYATELGLDRARFDAALDSGKYAAEVENDVRDGDKYGVTATPSIFINGVLLRALTAEDLRAAIDRALKISTSPKSPNR